MVRFVFLLIAVIGALGVLLALIFGMGVAKVASVNRPIDPPTSQPAATGPTTQSTVAATTQPTSPAIAAAGAALGIEPAPAVPVPPVAVVPPPAALPLPAPPANAPFVPGTILLRGADAKIHGKILQQNLPDGDLTSWTRESDYASWIFAPKAGKYYVDITRSNGASSGGKYQILLGTDRGGRVAIAREAQPTGGWNVFRTERIGIIELTGGRTTLNIAAAEEPRMALMQLRKIELVPVEPPVVAAREPDKRGDNPPTVLGLTIVDAATGRPLGMLTNGSRIDLSTLQPISLRAETTDNVASVQFIEDGERRPFDNTRPFSIAGEQNGVLAPWKPPPGKLSVNVLAFPERDGGGKVNKQFKVHIEIRSLAGIALCPEDAILHGDELQIEREEPPAISTWRRTQEWVEWETPTLASAAYKVQLVYACENGNGGEFVMRVGDTKFTGQVEGTGGWGEYKTMVVGRVELHRGRTRVAIKPADLPPGHTLMKLREVRLIVDDKK